MLLRHFTKESFLINSKMSGKDQAESSSSSDIFSVQALKTLIKSYDSVIENFVELHARLKATVMMRAAAQDNFLNSLQKLSDSIESGVENPFLLNGLDPAHTKGTSEEELVLWRNFKRDLALLFRQEGTHNDKGCVAEMEELARSIKTNRFIIPAVCRSYLKDLESREEVVIVEPSQSRRKRKRRTDDDDADDDKEQPPVKSRKLANNATQPTGRSSVKSKKQMLEARKSAAIDFCEVALNFSKEIEEFFIFDGKYDEVKNSVELRYPQLNDIALINLLESHFSQLWERVSRLVELINSSSSKKKKDKDDYFADYLTNSCLPLSGGSLNESDPTLPLVGMEFLTFCARNRDYFKDRLFKVLHPYTKDFLSKLFNGPLDNIAVEIISKICEVPYLSSFFEARLFGKHGQSALRYKFVRAKLPDDEEKTLSYLFDKKKKKIIHADIPVKRPQEKQLEKSKLGGHFVWSCFNMNSYYKVMYRVTPCKIFDVSNDEMAKWYGCRWNQWRVFSSRLGSSLRRGETNDTTTLNTHQWGSNDSQNFYLRHAVLQKIKEFDSGVGNRSEADDPFSGCVEDLTSFESLRKSIKVELFFSVAGIGDFLNQTTIKKFVPSMSPSFYCLELYRIYKQGLDRAKKDHPNFYHHFFPSDFSFSQPLPQKGSEKERILVKIELIHNPLISLLQSCLRCICTSKDIFACPDNLPVENGIFIPYLLKFLDVYDSFRKGTENRLDLRMTPFSLSKKSRLLLYVGAKNDMALNVMTHWDCLMPEDFRHTDASKWDPVLGKVYDASVIKLPSNKFEKKHAFSRNYLGNIARWLMVSLNVNGVLADKWCSKKIADIYNISALQYKIENYSTESENRSVCLLREIFSQLILKQHDTNISVYLRSYVCTGLSCLFFGGQDPLKLEYRFFQPYDYSKENGSKKLFGHRNHLYPTSSDSVVVRKINPGGIGNVYSNWTVFVVPTIDTPGQTAYFEQPGVPDDQYLTDFNYVMEYFLGNEPHTIFKSMTAREKDIVNRFMAYLGGHFQRGIAVGSDFYLEVMKTTVESVFCPSFSEMNLCGAILNIYKQTLLWMYYERIRHNITLDFEPTEEAKQETWTSIMKFCQSSQSSLMGQWIDNDDMNLPAFTPKGLFYPMFVWSPVDFMDLHQFGDRFHIGKDELGILKNERNLNDDLKAVVLTEAMLDTEAVAIRRMTPPLIPILSYGTCERDGTRQYRFLYDRKVNYCLVVNWALPLIYDAAKVLGDLALSYPISHFIMPIDNISAATVGIPDSCLFLTVQLTSDIINDSIAGEKKVLYRKTVANMPGACDNLGILNIKLWMELMVKLETRIRDFFSAVKDDKDLWERLVENFFADLPANILNHLVCVKSSKTGQHEFRIDIVSAILATLSTTVKSRHNLGRMTREDERKIEPPEYQSSPFFESLENGHGDYDESKTYPATFSYLAAKHMDKMATIAKQYGEQFHSDFSIQTFITCLFVEQIRAHTYLNPFIFAEKFLNDDPDSRLPLTGSHCMSNSDAQFCWLFGKLYQSTSGPEYRKMSFAAIQKVGCLSILYPRLGSALLQSQWSFCSRKDKFCISCADKRHKPGNCKKPQFGTQTSTRVDPIFSLSDFPEESRSEVWDCAEQYINDNVIFQNSDYSNVFRDVSLSNNNRWPYNILQSHDQKKSLWSDEKRSKFGNDLKISTLDGKPIGNEPAFFVDVTDYSGKSESKSGFSSLVSMVPLKKKVTKKKGGVRYVERKSLELEQYLHCKTGEIKMEVYEIKIPPHYMRFKFNNQTNFFNLPNDVHEVDLQFYAPRTSMGDSVQASFLTNFWKIVPHKLSIEFCDDLSNTLNGYNFIEPRKPYFTCYDGNISFWIFVFTSCLMRDIRDKIRIKINLHPVYNLVLLKGNQDTNNQMYPDPEDFMLQLEMTNINFAYGQTTPGLGPGGKRGIFRGESNDLLNHSAFMMENPEGVINLDESLKQLRDSWGHLTRFAKESMSVFRQIRDTISYIVHQKKWESSSTEGPVALTTLNGDGYLHYGLKIRLPDTSSSQSAQDLDNFFNILDDPTTPVTLDLLHNATIFSPNYTPPTNEQYIQCLSRMIFNRQHLHTQHECEMIKLSEEKKEKILGSDNVDSEFDLFFPLRNEEYSTMKFEDWLKSPREEWPFGLNHGGMMLWYLCNTSNKDYISKLFKQTFGKIQPTQHDLIEYSTFTLFPQKYKMDINSLDPLKDFTHLHSLMKTNKELLQDDIAWDSKKRMFVFSTKKVRGQSDKDSEELVLKNFAELCKFFRESWKRRNAQGKHASCLEVYRVFLRHSGFESIEDPFFENALECAERFATAQLLLTSLEPDRNSRRKSRRGKQQEDSSAWSMPFLHEERGDEYMVAVCFVFKIQNSLYHMMYCLDRLSTTPFIQSCSGILYLPDYCKYLYRLMMGVSIACVNWKILVDLLQHYFHWLKEDDSIALLLDKFFQRVSEGIDWHKVVDTRLFLAEDSKTVIAELTPYKYSRNGGLPMYKKIVCYRISKEFSSTFSKILMTIMDHHFTLLLTHDTMDNL